MTREERINLIDTYLNGQSTEAQQKIVHQMLQNDPSFRLELEEQKELWEALGNSEFNSFRNMVAQVVKEKPEQNNKKSFPLNSFLILAGVLVILFIGIWWLSGPSIDKTQVLFTKYFEAPAMTYVFRDATEGTFANEYQRKINNLYNKGDFRQALLEMQNYAEQFPEIRSSGYFYRLGILFLLNEQPQNAINAFEQIEVGYRNEKKWYLGLSYLKADKLSDAKLIFSEIAQSKSPFRHEADELLKELFP